MRSILLLKPATIGTAPRSMNLECNGQQQWNPRSQWKYSISSLQNVAVDTISLAEHPAIDVSIIEPLNGYTAILVDQSTLNLPREDSTGLTMYLPDELTERYPQLASILVDVREKVFMSGWAAGNMTDTTRWTARYLCCCQADLSVRPLTESGDARTRGSVAYNKWIEAQAKGCGGGRANKVREILGGKQVRCYAAHPSGVLSAQTKFSETDKGRRASFVRLMKTPYELMRGEFFFPRTIIQIEEDEHLDYETDLED
ncbi:hypothetical protein B0H14DRAFT_3566286 [Mycena olivaceomarginata]|nr:hypothetical protein B0H14DRAFT_3566286 [Mycena olivaceomarginata]